MKLVANIKLCPVPEQAETLRSTPETVQRGLHLACGPLGRRDVGQVVAAGPRSPIGYNAGLPLARTRSVAAGPRSPIGYNQAAFTAAELALRLDRDLLSAIMLFVVGGRLNWLRLDRDLLSAIIRYTLTGHPVVLRLDRDLLSAIIVLEVSR